MGLGVCLRFWRVGDEVEGVEEGVRRRREEALDEERIEEERSLGRECDLDSEAEREWRWVRERERDLDRDLEREREEEL